MGGNRTKLGSCLFFTRACSNRHVSASTSWAVKTILFSRPKRRSRLRRPKSASSTTVRAPSLARAMPRLAVVVVLPTPPLPEQIRIVRVVDTGIPLGLDQDNLPIHRDNFDQPGCKLSTSAGSILEQRL